MSAPRLAGPEAVSVTRRLESRRPARCSKRELQGRFLDREGPRRATLAPFAHTRLRSAEYELVRRTPNRAITSVPGEKAPAPIKVRLKRINCNTARAYPPDGQQKEWWNRLKGVLGTASSDFVNASLFQLISAARLPLDGISDIAVNAALAFIESAKPQEEVECALVIQMACTHTAAMAVLGRLGGGHGGDRHVAMMATAAARLVRAYATQVETLRRLRNGGSQYVRVEHVHVNAGGQALIGNIQGRRNKESSTHGA